MLREDLRIGLEGIFVPVLSVSPMTAERRDCGTPRRYSWYQTWPSRLISSLSHSRDGVDRADADAVETGGDLVARVVELAAGVEDRHHDLGRADALGVHPDRDAAAVVLDRDRAVEVDDDVDAASSDPPRCSSTALSTASQTRWCRPEPSWTSPMYMPGRLRTASRPSRTVMFSEPYDSGDGEMDAGRVASVIRMSRYNLRCGSYGVLRTEGASPFLSARLYPQGLYRGAIEGLFCPRERRGNRGNERPTSNARILAFLRPFRKEKRP